MFSNLERKVDIASLLLNDRKGARRQIQIANQAIDILSQKGVGGFSFELLAKKCKVTRTLIYKYFPTYEILITFLSYLIRHRYQEFVIQRMQSKTQFDDLFESYLESALLWVKEFPADSRTWIIYFHLSSVSLDLAEKNTALVDLGTERIITILQMGLHANRIQIKNRDLANVARLIQLMITGYLISHATESRLASEWEKLRVQVIRACWKLVR